MKLHQIPNGSKLRIQNKDGKVHPATFDHIDGAYSHCTIDDMESDNVFHLSASTPMVLVDGAYEIVDDLKGA